MSDQNDRAPRLRGRNTRNQMPLQSHFPSKNERNRRKPLGDATNQNQENIGTLNLKNNVFPKGEAQTIQIYDENLETSKAKRPHKSINVSISENTEPLLRSKRPNSQPQDRVLQLTESAVSKNIIMESQISSQHGNNFDSGMLLSDDFESGIHVEEFDVKEKDCRHDTSPMSICPDFSSKSSENNDHFVLTSVDEAVFDDPQYNAIYAVEIFEHYRKVEVDHVPHFGYMQNQREINEDMRRVLVDWLIEVHMNFKLKPESIFLAVNIMDRFLEKTVVSKSKLQLVGCASLLIAAKYEDIYAPEISELEYITKNAYTKDEVIRMESLICNKLKFTFTLPTSFHFIQRFLHAAFLHGDNGNRIPEHLVSELKTEAFFFLLLSLLEYKCLEHKPSGIAASALFLAFQRYQMEWNDQMVEFTEYRQEDIKECVCLIYKVYRKDRDMIKAASGKPSSASRYYSQKKKILSTLADQLL